MKKTGQTNYVRYGELSRIKGVTTVIKADVAGKQDKLTEAQMAAVNSGITAETISLMGKLLSWFGEDDNGDIYVIPKSDESPRNFWTAGNVSAGGNGGGGQGGGGVLYLLNDIYHSSTSVLRANGTEKQPGDALVYNSTLQKWVAAAQSGGSSVSWGTLGADNVQLTVDGVTKTLLTGHQAVSVASGTNNGTIKLTVGGVVTDNIAVKGLAALAYKASLAASDIPALAISKITGLQDALDGKQAVISDLATIRSGAAAGATAYQKPSTGIPKTDLASAVQTSLGRADSALQSHQTIYALTVQKNGTAVGTYTPNSAAATINITDVASASTLASLKTWIESMFVKEGSGTTADPYRIKANYDFYSVGNVSAGGNGGGGQGGGGALYALADVTAYNNQVVGRDSTHPAQSGDLLAYDGTHWHAVVAPATGVTSLGGQTGAVTVRGGQTANGSVNLTMNGTQLQASIVGLGSAAYTDSSAYATATQGAHADTAYGWGNHAGLYLPIEGGSVTGTFGVKRTTARYSLFYKNASASADYGTTIIDHTDVAGAVLETRLIIYDGGAKLNNNIIYHSGNLTAATLGAETTTHAAATYLPLTGGKINGNLQVGLDDNTAYKYLRVVRNGMTAELSVANRLTLSFDNGTDLHSLNILSDGQLVYDLTKDIYHSGNSNKSDVAWACSTLTASSNILASGKVTANRFYLNATTFIGLDNDGNVYVGKTSGTANFYATGNVSAGGNGGGGQEIGGALYTLADVKSSNNVIQRLSGGDVVTGDLFFKGDSSHWYALAKGSNGQILSMVGGMPAWIAAPATGVTSLGGQTGAVTVRGGQTANGSVNLTMNGTQLQASIVGLGSAAYTDSSAYATATQGAHADTAYGWGNHASAGYLTGITKAMVDAVGANADTLDGQHGSYYASASSLGNYLPLTGGKINGNLQIGLDDNTAYKYMRVVRSGYYAELSVSNRLSLYLSDGTTTHGLYILSDGRLTYDLTKDIYHSGNSNKSDVAWACSTLAMGGTLTMGGDEVLLAAASNLYVNRGLQTRTVDFFGTSIRFRNTGNVGIGTTSPTEKLHVAGNVLASGNVTAGSDRRWKDNINYSVNGISAIMALRPAIWTWKAGHGNGRGAGLIAQDVQSILPYAVVGSEEAGYTLNYNIFHAFEISAIQNHETRIEYLERRVNELEAENKRLRS